MGTTPDEIDLYIQGITLGEAGECAEQPVCMHVLIDNSPSVTGGTDPIGLRFREAALAIGRVGSRCDCGDDLVAIYSFDHPTSCCLTPTPIVPSNREAIEGSLGVPPDGAGRSELRASLNATLRSAKVHPDHRHVLVVLSDFELFDDWYQEMIDFPGDVHAVVLNGTPPEILELNEKVTIERIRHTSPPGSLARSIFTALTVDRPGSSPLPVFRLTGDTDSPHRSDGDGVLTE